MHNIFGSLGNNLFNVKNSKLKKNSRQAKCWTASTLIELHVDIGQPPR